MGRPVRRAGAVSSGSTMGVVLAAVVGGFLLYQCSGGRGSGGGVALTSPGISDAADTTERAESAAAEAVAGTTYSDQGAPYGCTDDCSGHNAGYEWASNNEVTDPSDCGGNSQSFIEGCQAYAEAYQEAKDQALENEP